MDNKPFYIKMIGGIAVSFLISQVLIGEVFLGKGTRIRPNLGSYIASKFLKPLVTFKNPLEGIFSQSPPVVQNTISSRNNSSTMFSNTINPNQSPKELLKDIPLNRSGKGIYTKSVAHVNYLLIREQEIEWEEYMFESKGKKISIKIPKGEEKPSQDIIKNLF
ncbi:hypothetical protein HY041_04375 [Candidatus Roizmanbacteria bacterium]|nr:hypothetical protein [Candidatus Roizmanbacteria bacterium]